MAASQRYSYADLPAELVRRIFAGAGDGYSCTLSLQDRLRADATCRAWRRALRGLPFHSLCLNRPFTTVKINEAKQQWAALAQPAVTCIVASDKTESHIVALHSVDRQRLEELLLEGEPRRILPHPRVFPNLRDITVTYSTWDHAWMKQLAQLRQLERLELQDPGPSTSQPQQPCVVGGFSALTSLEIWGEGNMQLRIDLASLPSLLELDLDIKAPIQLRTARPSAACSPAPGPSLQRLQLNNAISVAVDFGALPALTSLHLGEVSQLPGAASIAGATALRRLSLGGDPGVHTAEEFQLARPWVPELLRHAPPSLRSLRLYANWPASVSEAMAGLTQLRVLSLEDAWEGEEEEDAPPVRLADGPVWSRLRALRWACRHAPTEALRGATQLEVLHWYTAQMPTLLDWDAVSSLPALRHLRIITDRSFPEAGCAAMRSMACKSMPQVALQMTNYHCEQCSSEFAAAAARLTVS